MPFIHNQGANIYWDEQGSGEPLLLIAERCPALNQAETSDYRSEQVIEVMGDAARQLPDGVHLLGLDKLAFE